MRLNFWKQFLSAIVLTVAVCGVASAQTVEIDFRTGVDNTGTALDGQPVGFTTTVPEAAVDDVDLDITLTAISAGGVFNAEGSSTGVNSNTGAVEERQFDNGEFATFSFSQTVELLSGDFDQIGGGEVLTVTTSNGGTFLVTDAAASTDISDNNFNFGTFLLPVGETFTFTGTAGAIGVENLTVNVVPGAVNPAVPEPSSAALLGLLSLGVIARRRR